ncbi:MAG: CotH kinase family protein [Clostridia bacterium]|nr:CotH kinase family protein [Clostridia bacterium]
MKRVRTALILILCAVMALTIACARGNAGKNAGRNATPGNGALPTSSKNGGNNNSGPVPGFSAGGGVYDEPVKISLTLPENAPAGAYITYTENGDEPEAGSEKYKLELEIRGTAVIRAAIFAKNGSQLGPITTNTYIINSANGSNGSSGLRIVALAVDNDDLYSKSEGIFTNRSGTGSEWERPVSVEIYEPDGAELIHQDAGIRLAGSGSRSFDPASLRLIARNSEEFDETGTKYSGGGKFRADLFCTGFSEYDRFLLRNGGNDSPHQARANFLRMNLLRDCIANEYCAGLSERIDISVFAQRCVPVCVYLNGEYYGMSVMKEDFDERLISEQYGLEKDKITVIKGKKLYYQLESGDQAELNSWLELCEYAIGKALSGQGGKGEQGYAEAYKYVTDKIDVDNAAAYLAVMLYLCNTDWPQNNAMVWRYTGEKSTAAYSDGKWRFVIRDMDLCFALHDEPSRVSKTTYSMADTDTFYRLLVFYREGKGYDFDESLGLYGDDMKLQGLFDFLLRSEEFRGKFINICNVLCSGAEAEHMVNTANSFREKAKGEIGHHIDFWKAKGEIYSAYTYSMWLRSFEDINEFVSQRPGYFQKYLEETMEFYTN